MSVNSSELIKKIYDLTDIRVTETYRDDEAVSFAAATNTDSFTIVVHRTLGYLIEIHPAPTALNDDDVAVFEYDNLEACAKTFEALLTYKTMVIDKNMQELLGNL